MPALPASNDEGDNEIVQHPASPGTKPAPEGGKHLENSKKAELSLKPKLQPAARIDGYSIK